MMKNLKNWWKKRFSGGAAPAPSALRKTGAHRVTPVPRNKRPTPELKPKIEAVPAKFDTQIESNGPGKNVLIRNKFIREDTGTHETLKILDDSLIETGEETGLDPYNTGGFDRSKNWDRRFRK